MQINLEVLLKELGAALVKENKTVACAESCTGGLLAAHLTDLAGSSGWFSYGWVTYGNQAKIDLLGVLPSTLENHGAVSEETVLEMATAAKMKSKADFAISISGIAGPTGGSIEKPVGTVWFGLASQQAVVAFCGHFQGDRASIRLQAVETALQVLLSKVLA